MGVGRSLQTQSREGAWGPSSGAGSADGVPGTRRQGCWVPWRLTFGVAAEVLKDHMAGRAAWEERSGTVDEAAAVLPTLPLGVQLSFSRAGTEKLG